MILFFISILAIFHSNTNTIFEKKRCCYKTSRQIQDGTRVMQRRFSAWPGWWTEQTSWMSVCAVLCNIALASRQGQHKKRSNGMAWHRWGGEEWWNGNENQLNLNSEEKQLRCGATLLQPTYWPYVYNFNKNTNSNNKKTRNNLIVLLSLSLWNRTGLGYHLTLLHLEAM